MASARTQTDPAIQGTALGILADLLEELGHNPSGTELQPGTHLERDLGLGSLERVELLLRLNAAFSIQLPEQALAEAETIAELVRVVQASLGATAAGAPTPERLAGRPAAAWVPLPDSVETFVDVLRFRAGAMPDQPHVYLEDADGSERLLTYGRLLERATNVARWLEFHGLEPGDRVTLMLPTSEEFLASFFGVMLAGGIPVPIYPPFRADRIEEYAARQSAILRNAEARVLITFRAAERVARLLKPDVPSLERVVEAEILEQSEDKPVAGLRHRPKPDDICFLQYTSGSTGSPKGVIVTHAGLFANIRAMGEAVEAQPGDCAVSWLPLYHDMGLIGAWLLPFFFGFPLVLLSPISFLARPARWLRAIHRHRATLTAGPNFAYELCVRKIPEAERDGLDLSSLRGAMNGAEPVLPETLDRFAERYARYGLRPNAVIPVYGLAEATLAVSVPRPGRPARVDRIDRERFETRGRALPAPDDPHALAFVSVGHPIGCEVRIVDSQCQDVGERVEGQLWFRGPSATQGYFRNPEATAEIHRGGGWVDSGDRAYWAGGELFITGRTKDIIIKGGRNLYPHEIEEAVGLVEGVRRGCVVAFGVSDPQTGTERLMVVAETRNASPRAGIEADIVEATSQTVGVPPDVVRVVPAHSIPKTSSGKLRRTETKRSYLEGSLGVRPPPLWRQVMRLSARRWKPRQGAAARQMRRLLERIYGVYALAMFAVWLAPTAAVVALTPSRRAARRITAAACRHFLWTVGCDVGIEGGGILDRIRRGSLWPCVLSVNHTSYLDVIALLAVLPADCLFSAKQEVLHWPLLGTIARKMGEMSFDRRDPQARLRQAEQIEQALRQGLSVVVFPEGTFTPAPGIRPFLLGAFKAAAFAQRPVVPLALRGAREVWRDHTVLPQPGRVTLTFCSPLEPEGTGWKQIVELRDAARSAIAGPAGEALL
ncbi:MAG TPA: AMP-binding protein [Candidatus Acidoferrales bacterium]|nr:AMP-binding protein [Candidatus Acidoferrales bacterium]